MTRRWLCPGAALLYCLLTATSASAECAWVMWTQVTTSWIQSGNEAVEWLAAGVPTATDCYDSIKSTIKIQANKPSSPDEKRTVLSDTILRRGPSYGSITRYMCLPDTVDPRGPKGK